MRRSTTTATSADQGTARAPALTTLRRVAPYLWPDGQAWVKRRVIIALIFLLAAKLVSVEGALTAEQVVAALAANDYPATQVMTDAASAPGANCCGSCRA